MHDINAFCEMTLIIKLTSNSDEVAATRKSFSIDENRFSLSTFPSAHFTVFNKYKFQYQSALSVFSIQWQDGIISIMARKSNKI